jgi:alpha-mannosidase
VRNFRDHGRSSVSLMPFGYGDGGGGPTREMMSLGRIQADLEGSPRVRFGSAREFFVDAQDEYADPPVWSGEMYLEFHRGVFTSQARTKRGNRLGERLLSEAELWATTASIRCGTDYPHAEFESLWREVLLLQFHDILPGTAIAWVHREAEARHAAIAERLEAMISTSLAILAGSGDETFVVNSAPVAVGGNAARSSTVLAPRKRARGTIDESAIILESARLRVTITANGLISSVISIEGGDIEGGRELIPRGRFANLPQLHRDTPNQWDAWDLDASYRNTVTDLTAGTAELIENPTETYVAVTRGFGTSSITQRISLDETEPTIKIRSAVAWHERQKLLKLSFPFDVHADHSSSEIQFGHVKRAVHTNTSWDASKYEICAHRWLHVGEAGFGVAVANDSLYGHDVAREIDDGRVTTNVRQSLLRAPTFPDPDADQGEHGILTTVTIAPTVGDAVRAGYAANFPSRVIRGRRGIDSIIDVVGPAVVAETVKLAEDRSGDVIVRLYESEGGRASASLLFRFPIESVREVDLLERDLGSSARTVITSPGSDSVTVELRPFEVVTLRVQRRPETDQPS